MPIFQGKILIAFQTQCHYNSKCIANAAQKCGVCFYEIVIIYITEKYLFNAALRNVAIIISRHGFSDSARFAANGCLKENGKLIMNISDLDLISMLDSKLNGDSPEEILLTRLEDTLMKISK